MIIFIYFNLVYFKINQYSNINLSMQYSTKTIKIMKVIQINQADIQSKVS